VIGPPLLYATAVVYGVVVAAFTGALVFAVDHGVTRIRGVYE